MNWKTLMLWGVCAIALAAETGAELYQKALVKERGAGNLEEAIQLYQRVAREFPGDRALAAKALVQAARCYEKLGQDKAVKLYEQVARDFGDQRESATTARGRLAAIATTGKAAKGIGIVTRQIPVPSSALYADSDGRQVFSTDFVRGGLMVAGMDGKGARVIMPEDGKRRILGFSASQDGKQLAVWLRDSGKESLCVVRIDGSGLRVLSRNLRNAGDAQSPVMGWSTDGSRFLLRTGEEDGSYAVMSVSAQDGSLRKLKNTGPMRAEAAKFSPDGRYVAFSMGVGHYEPQGRDIHVLAVDGSYEGKLIEGPHANRFMDWTPDGGHVLFISDRGGAPALYSLAVSDGRPRGDPVLIKRDFAAPSRATMTKEGTLFYTIGGVSRNEILTADLDRGNADVIYDPRPISQRFVDSRSDGAWSPDGQHLAYLRRLYNSLDIGEYSLITRALDSGQERVFALSGLERARTSLGLSWAPGGAAVYAVFRPATSDGTHSVISISTATGAIKRIAQFPRRRVPALVSPTRDGKALMISLADGSAGPVGRVVAPSSRAGVIRHDLETGQETELITKEPASMLLLSPDQSRVAAVEVRGWNRHLSVKSLQGGDWNEIAKLEGRGGFAGQEVQWMPDGASVAVLDMNRSGAVLLRIPVEGGRPEKVAEFANLSTVLGFRLHPDGRKVLFNSRASRTELWALENFLPKQLAAR